MRLIDAEKLRHELIMGHDLVGAKYTDLAETVNAIPVDWINKWVVTKFVGAGRVIDSMLEDWEKENSLDKQIEKWEIDDDVDWEMIQREQGNDE